MIIDTIENLSKYESMNPLFSEVIAFLKANDLNKLEQGKHTIKGADLFVNITTANGKTSEEAVIETHSDMIDIQIPLDTAETLLKAIYNSKVISLSKIYPFLSIPSFRNFS